MTPKADFKAVNGLFTQYQPKLSIIPQPCTAWYGKSSGPAPTAKGGII